MIKDERVHFFLNYVIEPDYILSESDNYLLEETDDSGYTRLTVNVSGSNVCVNNYDKKRRCEFFNPAHIYGFKKCIDHFILQYHDDAWILHMIEMKKSVGASTWRGSIKPKMRSSYLNIQAFAAVMGIKISRVIAYTTYEEEKFDRGEVRETTNPVLYKGASGKPVYDSKRDEWDKDCMNLDIGKNYVIEHHKIQLKRDSDVLVGAYTFN